MTSKTIEQIVIESMEPTFAEMVTSKDYYFEEYSDTLHFMLKPKSLVEWLNYLLGFSISTTGTYNAACDVASTLESLCPEKYAGKFVY